MSITAGIEIPIHDESSKHLEETLNRYDLADPSSLPECITGIVILHLYAYADTRDEAGELHGYHDMLLFHTHLYVVDTMKTYMLGSHDGIHIDRDVNIEIAGIFKDGSTMLRFRGPLRIINGPALFIARWHNE